MDPLHNDQDDSFLATITAISDPGKFYVTRWCAMDERDRFFDSIQNAAPTCAAPNLIVTGEMYAVLNRDEKKWSRASIARTYMELAQVTIFNNIIYSVLYMYKYLNILFLGEGRSKRPYV